MNPTSVALLDPITSIYDDLFFGLGVSNDDALHSLLRNELRMFQCLQVNPKDCENPLMWWATHEAQFLHVALLAK